MYINKLLSVEFDLKNQPLLLLAVFGFLKNMVLCCFPYLLSLLGLWKIGGDIFSMKWFLNHLEIKIRDRFKS